MKEILKRYAYGIVFLSLKVLSYFPSQTLRRLLLKYAFFMQIGEKVTIYMGVEFRSPWKVKIGDHSIIGHNAVLDARERIVIGENINIGSQVMVWTLQHDYNDPDFRTKGGKVVIEDFAWISTRALILPNVTIGRGAVVAAGAVVTTDVPPYTVVGGIPARKIGERTRAFNYTLEDRGVPFV